MSTDTGVRDSAASHRLDIMGNRSFLYLGTHADFETGDGRPFAEANNSFPTLWRLLLAHGEPGTAIDDQRVFGDAGTSNLNSRARAAIARVRALAAGIRNHPLHDTQPYLDQHFDALLAYFEAEVLALAPASEDDLWFSANLDELSWLDGDAPDDFIAKERATCDAVAERVEAALTAQDFPSLDHALEIDSYGATFADWGSWAWNFGFGGLDHPYFSGSDEPRTIPFAEFRDDHGDDEEDQDHYLGNGLERFSEDGRTGVVKVAEVVGLRMKETQRTVIIPAEWDRVNSAGHLKQPLFWVSRDKRLGLLRADAKGQALLLPCELEEAWQFERAGATWVATVKQGGSLGLLGDDGRWIAEPSSLTPPLDEVWVFTGAHAIGASDGKQGVISVSGTWTVPPTFDEIDALQENGIAIARTGTTHQLLDVRTGERLTPPMAMLRFLDGPGVFEGRQEAAGTTGWWRADGKPLIAPAWDGIALLQANPWRALVLRDGLCGVRDRDDRECVAPVWTSLQARTDDMYPPIPGHLEEFVAEREGRRGLIDGAGRELIPLQYDAVDNFPPWSEDDGPARFFGPALQVLRETPEGVRVGVWNLELQREIIPVEFDHVHVITLYRTGRDAVWGYLAVHHAPGDRKGDQDPLRVGLFTADGTVLHAAKYAWIAERYHVTEYVDAQLVARAIAKAWGTNQPVQAALSDEDRYEWLRRDGTAVDDVAVRQQQFRDGDFTAAHALALQYRTGEGVAQDDALARRWMLLAAGQPETVFDAPAPGLFRRLLGEKPPSPLVPSNPDARGDVQAMCDLAQELVNGSQDPDELAAARAWMEIAVTRGAKKSRGNAEAHMLLGYMLLDGIGGPQDEARAHTVSLQAAALGDMTASFNLGLMYHFGRGVAIDTTQAMKHYTVASKAGDLSADLNLARILLLPAADGAPAAAKSAKQAVYHLQRACDCVSTDIAASAKGELGQLYWRGTGVKQDRVRARSLLREAADDGDVAAQEFLATEVDGAAGGT